VVGREKRLKDMFSIWTKMEIKNWISLKRILNSSLPKEMAKSATLMRFS
jgi:hypothetical protein